MLIAFSRSKAATFDGSSGGLATVYELLDRPVNDDVIISSLVNSMSINWRPSCVGLNAFTIDNLSFDSFTPKHKLICWIKYHNTL